MSGSPRIIAHADLDAFYASVEQRDAPRLRGRPVIVVGAGRRAVVLAASYEARQFGVRSAMPAYRARQLCPRGSFIPPHPDRYAAASRAVHAVLRGYSQQIEPLALDEAFLDITPSAALHGGAEALARSLKQRVLERTGLTMTVAVGPNKLVAKLACGLAKPDGCVVIRPEQVEALLAPLPVRRLWGVGPVLERQLRSAGLETLAELASASTEQLRALVGDRAHELRERARGRDERPVVSDRDSKSCGHEATFEQDELRPARLRAALREHAVEVATRLCEAALRGRVITVKAKLARRRQERPARSGAQELEPVHVLVSRSRTLGRATDDPELIATVAWELWEAAGVREPVRLLGVSVSQLCAARQAQLELFRVTERRRPGVEPTLERIRARYGEGAIQGGGAPRPER